MSARRPAVSGSVRVFCVVKKKVKDRLIFDARPANALEIGSSCWTRCLASAVAELRRQTARSGFACPGLISARVFTRLCRFMSLPERMARNSVVVDADQIGFVFRKDRREHCDHRGCIFVPSLLGSGVDAGL